jgi:glucose dehydrogenase
MAMHNRLVTRKDANERGYFPAGRGESPNFIGLAQHGTPYGAEVSPFMSPIGVPCQEPPFSTLTAIDMRTKKVIWTRPLGVASNSGPMGVRSHIPLSLGVPLNGGAITTASGLTFIAASQDEHIRAYDTRNGKILWEDKLPAGGQATPMTYRSSMTGRQYVTIAAGGSLGFVTTRPGDYIVAYTLK